MNTILLGVGITAIAIFVIGYLSLGPIGRAFVKNPVDIFGHGIQTIGNTAEQGISKVQDSIPKVTQPTPQETTAQLVLSTHPETSNWSSQLITETFSMKPQETRTYKVITEGADIATLTGTVHISGSDRLNPLKPSIKLTIDNGSCSKAVMGCNERTFHDSDNISIRIFTGSTQNLIVTNTSGSARTVTLNLQVAYTKTTQVSDTQ